MRYSAHNIVINAIIILTFFIISILLHDHFNIKPQMQVLKTWREPAHQETVWNAGYPMPTMQIYDVPEQYWARIKFISKRLIHNQVEIVITKEQWSNIQINDTLDSKQFYFQKH